MSVRLNDGYLYWMFPPHHSALDLKFYWWKTFFFFVTPRLQIQSKVHSQTWVLLLTQYAYGLKKWMGVVCMCLLVIRYRYINTNTITIFIYECVTLASRAKTNVIASWNHILDVGNACGKEKGNRILVLLTCFSSSLWFHFGFSCICSYTVKYI